MISTPENTAVVCLRSLNNADVVSGFRFFSETAKRVGISLFVFEFVHGQHLTESGEQFSAINFTANSYLPKIKLMEQQIASLPESYKYILYVDCRDSIFVRPLSDICEGFNRIGWPVLFGAVKKNVPHIDPAWKARFRTKSNGYSYLNAGVWMAERRVLTQAFKTLAGLKKLVADNIIESSAHFLHNDDQHVWQTAYAEDAIPMRLDFKQEIFCNAIDMDIGEFDFLKSTKETPVVLQSGARPAIIHFNAESSRAIPFFSWFLRLVPLPVSSDLSHTSPNEKV